MSKAVAALDAYVPTVGKFVVEVLLPWLTEKVNQDKKQGKKQFEVEIARAEAERDTALAKAEAEQARTRLVQAAAAEAVDILNEGRGGDVARLGALMDVMRRY